MFALGHKRTFWNVRSMSALPPKADIAKHYWNVRFVPQADIRRYQLRMRSCAQALVQVLPLGCSRVPWNIRQVQIPPFVFVRPELTSRGNCKRSWCFARYLAQRS